MFFKRKKEASKLAEAVSMREVSLSMQSERLDYYTKIIIQLLRGSHQMGSEVINFEPIKGWYGYYGIDNGTIVFYNQEICDRLYNEGIASYNNSSGGLVVTTSPDRVKNLKK